jgi:(p)ppGpp synthase/HD superfamily hydrolase
VLTRRVPTAVGLALEWHLAQDRTGTGVPYLAHPLAVAALVLEDGGEEDEVLTALLHDAVEDAGGPVVADRIRAEFGDRVADAVLGCSDSVAGLGVAKDDWAVRKRAFLARLGSPDTSAHVLRVAAADKLHNLRSLLTDHRRLGAAVFDRFTASAEQTVWYYDAAAVALRRRLPDSRSAAELDLAVGELYRALGRPRPERPAGAPPDQATTAPRGDT